MNLAGNFDRIFRQYMVQHPELRYSLVRHLKVTWDTFAHNLTRLELDIAVLRNCEILDIGRTISLWKDSRFRFIVPLLPSLEFHKIQKLAFFNPTEIKMAVTP